MLYLVGLGLSPEHLSEMARKVLERVDKVYLDTYTNIIQENEVTSYESIVGKRFVRAKRQDLEDGMTSIIEEAREREIAVAVPGDPLTATTHISIYIEALRRNVNVRYIPGISIHTVAMSLSGLQHYKFGPVVTVPHHWEDAPSFYEKLYKNRKMGLHTLLLLDLHPEPLDIRTALHALLYWEKKKKLRVIELGDLVVGIARAGKDDCFRFVGTVEELLDIDWGKPPHSLVIPGELHPVEEEILYTIRRYQHGRCERES